MGKALGVDWHHGATVAIVAIDRSEQLSKFNCSMPAAKSPLLDKCPSALCVVFGQLSSAHCSADISTLLNIPIFKH